MKFFHVVLGRGRSDVEYDVSDLEPNQRHMFAFTWSTEAQKLKIFIDGEEAACSNMAHPSAVSA
jgi:uracil DNA glycosylase